MILGEREGKRRSEGVKSNATTIEEYLAELPEERRGCFSAVRDLILENLPEGYVEAIGWGMVAYSVPLSVYPDTYNKQPLLYIALGNQKQKMSLYMMGLYGDAEVCEGFVEAWKREGRKLDMGKSCIRFKRIDDLDLELLAEEIARVPMEAHIAHARAVRGKGSRKRKK